MKNFLLAALLLVAVSGGAAAECPEDSQLTLDNHTISILEAGPSFVIPVMIDGAVLAIHVEQDCAGCHARGVSSLAVFAERHAPLPESVAFARAEIYSMDKKLEHGDRQAPWLPPNWRATTMLPPGIVYAAAQLSNPLLT